MNRRSKIILTIAGLSLLTIVFLFFNGFHLMAIEDYYGDHQDFYYNSKQGDIVLNKDLGEFREIKKNWTRIYLVNKTDTLDLFNWVNDHKIEVYRPEKEIDNAADLTLKEGEELIGRKYLKLVMKN